MFSTEAEATDVYGHEDGDWLWMSVVIGSWGIFVGMVVYAAVRFAHRDHGGGRDR